MKHTTRLICSLGIAVSTLGAESSAVKPVDAISQAGIQSAFQILQKEYIRKDDLTFDELNRSALQGLLSRLNFGAELEANVPPAPAPPGGLHSELLLPDVAYLRLDSYSESEVTQVELTLKQFADQSVRSLILDLRAPVPPGSFDVAAGLLDLFLPRGIVLFKMKQLGQQNAELVLSRTDAVWTSPLIVLIDEETGSVGEAIAGVLSQQKRALLVGMPTRGATVRYDRVPVDDKWSLRFAREEMLLPDDSSLFMKGLQPDFVVSLPSDTKHTLFKISRGNSIKPHVFDETRPRYNEAALVARKHPELDAYIRRSAGELTDEGTQPARDLVLQRAVDMLLSSHFLTEEKFKWPKPTPASPKQTADASPPRAEPVKER